MFFYKSLKTCFFVFFMFLCFFVLFNVVFLLLLKTKNAGIQNYKYDAFLVGKDSISWTERVFCSSIIDFI